MQKLFISLLLLVALLSSILIYLYVSDYQKSSNLLTPVDMYVWKELVEERSGNSKIKLNDDSFINVLVDNKRKEDNKLTISMFVSEHNRFEKEIIACKSPFFYVTSNNEDIISIQIFINKTYLDNPDWKISIAPNDSLAKELVFTLKRTGEEEVRSSVKCCELILDMSGNVKALFANPVFSEIKENSFRYTVKKILATSTEISKYLPGSEKIWTVDLTTNNESDVIGIYNKDSNGTIVILRFCSTIRLSGKLLFTDLINLDCYHENYVAIIVLDENGEITCYSVAGPFWFGSEGWVTCCTNNDGSMIFLNALKSRCGNVSYVMNGEDKKIILDSISFVSSFFQFPKINHSQCLLVINSNGQLLSAVKMADGYFTNTMMQVLSDSTLGLCTTTGGFLHIGEDDNILNFGNPTGSKEYLDRLFLQYSDVTCWSSGVSSGDNTYFTTVPTLLK